jgi:hypothetical protein
MNAPPSISSQTWTIVRLDEPAARDEALASSREFLTGDRPGLLYYDLDWRVTTPADWNAVSVCFYQDGVERGYAPFVKSHWPLPLQLGEIRIAAAPLTRYTLNGEPLRLPHDAEWSRGAILSLVRALGGRLSAREALYFEGLPTDGVTYRMLMSDPEIERTFLALQIGASYEHQFLNLPGTYDEYLAQLGGRSRQSVQYSERKLERDMAGQVRCECFETAAQVDRFIADAAAISRKTYQWRLLGLGLRAADELKGQLSHAANAGWLRSYILYCNDTPVSFMLGNQYRGCYYYLDVGYDPEFARWSVGTVLQLKVLKDLYSRGTRPTRFDFSTGFGEHKARFSNASRSEAHVLLLPRTPGNRVWAGTYVGLERGSRKLVAFLDRIGVKKRVKRLVRRLWPSEDARREQ